jgi:PAS domain S-box-containing protein
MICCIAPDGTTVAINPAGERLTGYEASELVGNNFWHTLFPGDEYQQVAEGVLDTLEEVDVLDYEMTITTKQGLARIISWSLISRYDQGNLVEIIGFGIDVTKRRQAENEREHLLHALEHRSRQLQLAAEVATSVSTLLDTQKLIAQTVERIKEAFDYYYVGLFLVDEASEYAVLRAGTGAAGRKMLAAGHKLKIGDGSLIGWSVANGLPRIALDVGQDDVRFNNPPAQPARGRPAAHQRGQRIGALTFQSNHEAAFSDNDLAILSVMAEQLAVAIENTRLYEQVQQYATDLEKRVAERTAELTAVNKELEAFAYSVSHDLRAPLRAIDGFSQALLEDYAGCLDATGQDYLHRVQTATRRMGQLINDLLKLSRLTRGEMHRERVDLSALANEVLADLCTQQPDARLSSSSRPAWRQIVTYVCCVWH